MGNNALIDLANAKMYIELAIYSYKENGYLRDNIKQLLDSSLLKVIDSQD